MILLLKEIINLSWDLTLYTHLFIWIKIQHSGLYALPPAKILPPSLSSQFSRISLTPPWPISEKFYLQLKLAGCKLRRKLWSLESFRIMICFSDLWSIWCYIWCSLRGLSWNWVSADHFLEAFLWSIFKNIDGRCQAREAHFLGVTLLVHQNFGAFVALVPFSKGVRTSEELIMHSRFVV